MIISNAHAEKALEILSIPEITELYNHVFNKKIKKVESKAPAIKKILESGAIEHFTLFDGEMSLELQEILISACQETTGVYFNRNAAFDSAFIRKKGVGKFIQDQIFQGVIDSDEIVKRIRENPDFKHSNAGSTDVAFVKTQLRKSGFVVPMTSGRRKAGEAVA